MAWSPKITLLPFALDILCGTDVSHVNLGLDLALS